MGKRIITQRRGRGTMTYTANSHTSKGKTSYRFLDDAEKNNVVKGIVADLIHCGNHNAPLAVIRYETGEVNLIPAVDGIYVGKDVEAGAQATPAKGNTMPLKNIPEGTSICYIESFPGKGSFCKSAGSFATVVQRSAEAVTIRFPSSRKEKVLNPNCRATLGVVAGGGKRDKPFVKAGPVHHKMRSKGQLYPKTSGVAMNAVDHPFGSGRGRHVGKPKTAPRHAPAGRNVGLIKARRTGRKR